VVSNTIARNDQLVGELGAFRSFCYFTVFNSEAGGFEEG